MHISGCFDNENGAPVPGGFAAGEAVSNRAVKCAMAATPKAKSAFESVVPINLFIAAKQHYVFSESQNHRSGNHHWDVAPVPSLSHAISSWLMDQAINTNAAIETTTPLSKLKTEAEQYKI